MAPTRPRVLVLARNYPSDAFPMLGLWVERMVEAATPIAAIRVVAPVPFAPPFVPLQSFRRYRAVPQRSFRHGHETYHPRIPVAPGYVLHAYEARMVFPWIARAVDRLLAKDGVDLIHAHFIYPEGVMAARLGRRLGVPVIVSEHNVWLPWLERFPGVRRQVIASLPGIRLVAPVSRSVEATIKAVAADRVRTELLPNVLDAETFRARRADEEWDPNRLLFVGAARHVKGLDVLVRALSRVARARPEVHLTVIGEPFYRAYRRHEKAVRQLVGSLGLEGHVTFDGYRKPKDVAAAMRESAAVVVPSRRESFSLVTAEALASGTPVAATRCGGPEEMITAETGRLAPVNDPSALAVAIEEVLTQRTRFAAATLRAAVVPRFAQPTATDRLAQLYRAVLV